MGSGRALCSLFHFRKELLLLQFTFARLFEHARDYGTLQWEGWIQSLRGGHTLIDDVYDDKRREDIKPRKDGSVDPADDE